MPEQPFQVGMLGTFSVFAIWNRWGHRVRMLPCFFLLLISSFYNLAMATCVTGEMGATRLVLSRPQVVVTRRII